MGDTAEHVIRLADLSETPHRVSMTDGSGTTTYAYVPVGFAGALQLQQETMPLSNATIAYGFDALGRLVSRTVAGQGAETFTYDTIGRLTGHTSDLGSFTLAYLGQTSQITSRTLTGSNLATTWGYLSNASDRRLASVGTTGLTSGQSTTFSYVSNAGNEATGQTQTSESSIAYPPGSLQQTASYNTLNQLTNLSGQAQTFDADGNLLSDGSRTYSWDAENRLIAITYPGQPSKATTFAYDALGRRVQWSSTPTGGGSAVVTNYLWCAARLCQARNASNAPTRGYYAEGEFVSGSPSASDYYAPDRLGSVRRVFSASASPTFDFDPYGNALQATVPVTDYGYAGMVANADSGLYLTTNRPYDPVSGRFLLRDPIGEAGDPAGNLYAYVGGDPVDGRDPSGLAGIGPIPLNLLVPPLAYFASAVTGGPFQWYGNYGGPGWSYGGWHSEHGPIPTPGQPGYVAPIDPEDACYESHDRCIHDCPLCPPRGNKCDQACDWALLRCLRALPTQSPTSLGAEAAFSGPVQNWVH